MGGIRGALLVGRRIVAKDRGAEVRTGTVAGQGQPPASQTEQTTDGGRQGFEGLAAGSRSRQGFGQVVKLRRVHLCSLLSQGTNRTSWGQVGTRSQDSGCRRMRGGSQEFLCCDSSSRSGRETSG
jgi:hypothetical protein